MSPGIGVVVTKPGTVAWETQSDFVIVGKFDSTETADCTVVGYVVVDCIAALVDCIVALVVDCIAVLVDCIAVFVVDCIVVSVVDCIVVSAVDCIVVSAVDCIVFVDCIAVVVADCTVAVVEYVVAVDCTAELDYSEVAEFDYTEVADLVDSVVDIVVFGCTDQTVESVDCTVAESVDCTEAVGTAASVGTAEFVGNFAGCTADPDSVARKLESVVVDFAGFVGSSGCTVESGTACRAATSPVNQCGIAVWCDTVAQYAVCYIGTDCSVFGNFAVATVDNPARYCCAAAQQ